MLLAYSASADLIQFMQLWFSVSHINFPQTVLVKLPLHTRRCDYQMLAVRGTQRKL